MRLVAKIWIWIVIATAMAACDTQRDLYVEVSPALLIHADWIPSLNEGDMSMNATAVSYSDGELYSKEYFYAADNAMIPVTTGVMDILIFNGLMYDADDTHLDGITFRGIDRLDTFEAVAMETEPIRRMSRADGEYIATNNMEVFTSMAAHKEIGAEGGYAIKYMDGENQGDVQQSVDCGELELTPAAMSYKAQIVVELENISSAYGANAALRGFAGSAYVADRRPSHFLVTHQFNLNSKKITDNDKDIGTIESPVFVTFGPPVDMPGNTYEVYIMITLVNGEVVERTFDITEQVLPMIDQIKLNLSNTGQLNYNLKLPNLKLELDLPDVEPPANGYVGVDDWEDDEIIRVPITN